MEKSKTLPRTQRDASPTLSSSSYALFRNTVSDKNKKFPPIRSKKKKKKNKAISMIEIPGSDSVGSNLSEAENVSKEEQITASGTASSFGASMDSQSLQRGEDGDDKNVSKSPRVKKKMLKSLIKGGKNFITFKGGKRESTPVMVESMLDIRRSMRKDKIDVGEHNAPDKTFKVRESRNETVECKITTTPTEEDDEDYDWSATSTCARVKKLLIAERRESVYKDKDDEPFEKLHTEQSSSVPAAPEMQEDDVIEQKFDPFSSSFNAAETLSDNTGDNWYTFDKKSPASLKKEILRVTKTRKTSESSLNGTNVSNRRISLQARNSQDKNELLFKILVIGELGTGKTSIIKRYVHQFFSQHYRATIGVDFALKVLSWDNNTTIRLQLWDIAGQERFGNMTRVYYKESVGAFIVFDVTRVGTFEAVVKWKQDLDSKVQLPDGGPIPCVLLANKCDQPKEGLVNNQNKMDEFCRVNDFVAWFETSAKENINIDEAAHFLVNKIIQNDQKRQEEKEVANGTSSHAATVSVDNTNDEKKKSCAC